MDRLSPLLVPALVTLLVGCTPSDRTRPSDATAMHDGQPVVRYEMSIDDFARLAPRAVAAQHWAVVKQTDEVTGYRVEALTPDDRPVDIRARQTHVNAIKVSVRVGRFANAEDEALFLDTFARLAARPD